MLGELLELLKTPVTVFTKRARERNVKKEAIIALVVASVIALVSVFTSYISITKTLNETYKSLEEYNENLYSWEEEVTKSEFKEMKKEAKEELFEDAELVKSFFKTIAVTAVVIAVVAGILFVISRMVKSPKDYIEMISMVNSAFIIYLIGFLLNTIFSYIYVPAGIIAFAGAIIFAIISLANSYAESLQVEDTNKLVIYSSIVLTVVFAILVMLVANYIDILFSFSSLSSIL